MRELTKSLSALMIQSESFYYMAKSIGIDHEDWPADESRELVSEFEQLKGKHNFNFAAHEMLGKVKGRYTKEISFDKNILSEQYEKKLDEFRAKMVGEMLIRSPELSREIMVDYLLKKRGKKTVVNLKESIKGLAQENERRIAEGKSVVKIKNWEYLSQTIGGWNPGRVGLLTAATGFGKTTLAVNLALNAGASMDVLCVNMEMMVQDFGERFIMAGSSIEFNDWRSGEYDVKRLSNFASNGALERIWFTDGSCLSIDRIYSMALERKRTGLDFMIVDYDQKIDLKMPRGTPEWKALQVAIQELEEIAKELEIFILVMSQSNDAGDPSGSKRSKYSAAVVLNFYRNDDGNVLIKAMKNRFGKQGVCIECNYRPEKSFVEEQRIFQEPTVKGLRL